MIEKFLLLCSGNSGKMQLLIIQRQTSLNPRNYVMHLTQEMLLTKVHVLVKHKILFINHFKLNVDINKIYREKSIPMTALWCLSSIQLSWLNLSCLKHNSLL